MIETATKSPGDNNQTSCNLPRRAHNLALRVLQLAKEPGEYQLTIIVHPDGRWQLKPPPKIEDLG